MISGGGTGVVRPMGNHSLYQCRRAIGENMGGSSGLGEFKLAVEHSEKTRTLNG